MKLRSITLENVRRFTEPVRLGPIGNGVTLLCAPNESGKSTLFDALHALFFVKHTSWSTRDGITGLQPHSGGKVIVECELDHDDARWRVRKRWQSGAGGEARVWREGDLVHQGDAAEDWIGALVAGDRGGPSGLLWVRQGRVSLEHTGPKSEREAEHDQRRDLLTAVSGAMDAVTGGERMDAALDATHQALGLLQTATGKPKANGAWSDAETGVRDLSDEAARLGGLVQQLREALDERQTLRTELDSLSNPEIIARQGADLAAAEVALEAARRHGEAIAAAETRAALARQSLTSAKDAARRAGQLRAELAEASVRAEEAEAAAETTGQAFVEADGAHRTAASNAAQAETALRAARQGARAAEQRDAAISAAEGRAALQDRIDRAEAAEQLRIERRAHAATGPGQDVVARSEELARRVATLRDVREASAPRIKVDYLPGAKPITLAGQPVDGGVLRALSDGDEIEMHGIGRLTVGLGKTADAGRLEEAEAALRTVLEEGGWSDLDALRLSAKDRQDAEREAIGAEHRRDALAPDGIAALREALARLPEPISDAAQSDLPNTDVARRALEMAEAEMTAARTAEAATRERLDVARDADTRARSQRQAAHERHERAAQAVRDLPTDIDETGAQLAKLETAASDADEAVSRLQVDAPDLAKAQATRDRLDGVVQQARSRTGQIRERLATLEARIETRAEEGVEEALSDVQARLEKAIERRDRVVFEVDTLNTLKSALEAAQGAAREAYFGPVAQELRPLLEDLWPDAEVLWSDDTLLPRALIRKGTEEPIDVLSGGTQEQIAFLVRLAFARLLAKAGRPAPLILDDALVYTDDDRIGRMFDALHGAAADLQIIVLSCRQRAFRDLGAPQIAFEPLAGA